jgi:hypothetical protein
MAPHSSCGGCGGWAIVWSSAKATTMHTPFYDAFLDDKPMAKSNVEGYWFEILLEVGVPYMGLL